MEFAVVQPTSWRVLYKLYLGFVSGDVAELPVHQHERSVRLLRCKGRLERSILLNNICMYISKQNKLFTNVFMFVREVLCVPLLIYIIFSLFLSSIFHYSGKKKQSYQLTKFC